MIDTVVAQDIITNNNVVPALSSCSASSISTAATALSNCSYSPFDDRHRHIEDDEERLCDMERELQRAYEHIKEQTLELEKMRQLVLILNLEIKDEVAEKQECSKALILCRKEAAILREDYLKVAEERDKLVKERELLRFESSDPSNVADALNALKVQMMGRLRASARERASLQKSLEEITTRLSNVENLLRDASKSKAELEIQLLGKDDVINGLKYYAGKLSLQNRKLEKQLKTSEGVGTTVGLHFCRNFNILSHRLQQTERSLVSYFSGGRECAVSNTSAAGVISGER